MKQFDNNVADLLNDPYKNLACAIIKSAILNFDYEFFKSTWGQTLCEILDVEIPYVFKIMKERDKIEKIQCEKT